MRRSSLFMIGFICLTVFLLLPGCNKDNDYPTKVTDIDGNIYGTVKIGSQVWMAENLKVTRYRNGDQVLNVLDGSIWDYLSTGAYCTYDHSSSIAALYGNLYNWHAVNDPRKLAPEGWHVPSDDDWRALNAYLGDETAGGKIKEKDTMHWHYPNVGATDEYGFSALPAGLRSSSYVGYTNLELNTWWWTASLSTRGSPLAWGANYDQSSLAWKEWYPTFGFSVRCIKD